MAFMRLKKQRRYLFGSALGAAGLALGLGGALWTEQSSPEVVRLGEGVASVNDRAVTTMAANRNRAPLSPDTEPTPDTSGVPIGEGDASYYGQELAGKRTASGERFDPVKLTAAHRTLPLGSKVRVTNPRNGESVVVRINDRGPFHGNRVIDLSHSAARVIGLVRSGTGRVRMALLVP